MTCGIWCGEARCAWQHHLKIELAAEGEVDMTTRFLAIAMTVASLFGVQQAVAKTSTKTTAATKKKHHKHNMKKAAAPRITAPTA
jgi:hypothetical protein